MEFERRERFVRHIDLTALVDVVFHLMVFFMLTTTFVVSESMELALPSSATAPASTISTPSLTRIVVAQGGRITIGGTEVSADQLQTILITTLGEKPDARIVILSTPGVLVQELVSVLDMVYFAGGRNVQVDKGVI